MKTSPLLYRRLYDGDPARRHKTRSIERSVQNYFDGLITSDLALLEKTFHPTVMISGYSSVGKLNTMSLDTFLKFVETAPAPKETGSKYDMEIVSTDITGAIAAAKVRNLYLNRMFIDYLHLVETPVGWKIISKAFHSDPT